MLAMRETDAEILPKVRLLFSPVASARAFLGPSDARPRSGQGASLVELGTRVFDLEVDAARVLRDPHFIPINRGPWTSDIVASDPKTGAAFVSGHGEDRFADTPNPLPRSGLPARPFTLAPPVERVRAHMGRQAAATGRLSPRSRPGFWTHNQNDTVAASAMADRNTMGHLS